MLNDFSMLVAANRSVNEANAALNEPPEPQPAIDCDELLDLINAAQALYTEHCPIAKPAPTEDTQ